MKNKLIIIFATIIFLCIAWYLVIYGIKSCGGGWQPLKCPAMFACMNNPNDFIDEPGRCKLRPFMK